MYMTYSDVLGGTEVRSMGRYRSFASPPVLEVALAPVVVVVAPSPVVVVALAPVEAVVAPFPVVSPALVVAVAIEVVIDSNVVSVGGSLAVVVSVITGSK